MTLSPSTPTSLKALLVTAGLLLSACAADATAFVAEPTPTDVPTVPTAPAGPDTATTSHGDAMIRTELDDSLQALLANLSVGYSDIEGAWIGFSPVEHPVVVAVKDDAGTLTAALAINHPDPAALGDATQVDTDDLAVGSVHYVKDPVDKVALERLDSFDFHLTIGGVDSFAIVAGGSDGFFDPTKQDYVGTLIHEVFHRYQDEAFNTNLIQDFENYPYDASNFELALLEERALSAANLAETADGKTEALRWFAALRHTRLAANDRVAHDNAQESIEGTARWLEHVLAENNDGYHVDGGGRGIANSLRTNFEESGNKEWFGFGRFYSTGAAIVAVLNDLGVDDFATRIEAGASPAEIAIAELAITNGNADELVAQARSVLDPAGEVSTDAAAAADRATSEPAPFSEDEQDGRSEDVGPVSGEGQAITADEEACLAEGGFDVDVDEVISDELFESCFGAT